MKHPKLLFGFMIVLGTSLLTAFFAIYYWYSLNIGILKMQVLEQNMGYFFCFFFVGGAVLLAVGTLRINMPSIKKHRWLLAVSIPAIASLLFFYMVSMSVEMSFSNSFATRSEITSLRIVDSSPLVLTVNVKATTDYDSTIYGAVVRGLDGHFVTWQEKTIMKVYDEGAGSYLNQSQVELPAGSARLLTLEFYETLPPGNYSVLLFGGMHYNQDSSPFIIP